MTTPTTTPCGCFVSKHERAAEIDEALLRGDDPREVASQFKIGKSRVYEHRTHLRNGTPPATGTPALASAAGEAPDTEGTVTASASEVTKAAREPTSRPLASTALSQPQSPVERSMEPAIAVETTVPQRGIRGMENGTERQATTVPSTAITARALPGGTVQSAYQGAVARSLSLITGSEWRPGHVAQIAIEFGLSRASVRAAHAEAARHLQLDMGGYLERQAVSAAYVTAKRDEASAQSALAKSHAERWRAQEREAQDRADTLQGADQIDTRIETLKTAAHFGMLATKYDLSAEKWSAQALAHQRHLDDILCLKGPKEATQNVFNLGSDPALFEKFAALLAAKFRDRPDVLAELDAAAAEIERGSEPGASQVIDAVGEAA